MARVGDLRGERGDGRDPSTHDAKGPDRSPVVSPDGRLVAYIGYDWTDDTYVEAKLIMGIDGSNPA